jgi:hypothetical protein
MTRELLGVIYHYVRWSACKNACNEYAAQIAIECLHEKRSYKLPATTDGDRWLGFRLLKRTLTRIFSIEKTMRSDVDYDAIIISGTEKLNNHATQYIKRSAKVKEPLYVAKDSISLHNSGALYLLLVLLFGSWKAVECFFRRKRSNHALVISTMVEISLILYLVKKTRVNVVYDFVPYENDSNLLYVLLKKKKVTVCKIPSSNPLVTHHIKTLTDQIVLSNPYQLDEIERIRHEIYFTQIVNWPPDRAYLFLPAYSPNRPKVERNCIGFYSHGEWLRKANNDADYGHNIGMEEEKILNYLRDYQKEYPEIKILIFPHPKELAPQNIHQAKNYYAEHLSGAHFEFFEHRGGTSMHFHEVNIAVCAFSAVVFERLFAGFKILISSNAIRNFPLPDNPINNICFDDYPTLKNKLNQYLDATDIAFFDDTQLTGFLYTEYAAP